MAQDHGLCRKKVSQQMYRCTGRHCRPVLQLPTGQFVAYKLLALTHGDPGAHGRNRGKRSKMNGAKWNGGKANLNGGKLLRRAVGMAGKVWQANKSLQNKATAGGHSRRTLRPAQASKHTNGPQLAGLAAKTQQLPDDVVLPSVQLGGGGVQRCWHSGRRVQTYLHCPYPT